MSGGKSNASTATTNKTSTKITNVSKTVNDINDQSISGVVTGSSIISLTDGADYVNQYGDNVRDTVMQLTDGLQTIALAGGQGIVDTAFYGYDTVNNQNQMAYDLFGNVAEGLGNVISEVLSTTDKNLQTIQSAFSQAVQPDADLVKQQSQMMPWIIGAALVVVAVAVWRK